MIKYAIVLKPSQLSSNGPVQRQKISKNSATHPEKNKQTNSWTIWISISTHLPLNDEASISQDIMVFLAIHLRSGNQTHGEVEILWNSHI